MSYLWQEFNIKTFPAETLVFRDSVFCPELSDYKNPEYSREKNLILINKKSKLPVHIIYFGEIAGNIDLNININIDNLPVFMTFKTFNKKPAFLNIFVKNAGKNSVFNGNIIIKNHRELNIRLFGEHFNENTGIFIHTKVAAYKNSINYMEGIAKINKNMPECDSDISFTVMADNNSKITIKPTQYINSIPKNAAHSASLYKPNDNQIYYLQTSGLSSKEIKELLEKAFLEEY